MSRNKKSKNQSSNTVRLMNIKKEIIDKLIVTLIMKCFY